MSTQTGAEYFQEEERHLNQELFNLTRLEYAQYCYDATWTLAYALNRTIKRMSTLSLCLHYTPVNLFTEIDPTINPSLNQHLAEAYRVDGTFQIESFTYGNDALTDLIFHQLEDTSFNGITVRPSLLMNIISKMLHTTGTCVI